MEMQPHRPRRQDTFDLRDRIHPDDTKHAHQQYGQMDAEQSIMEDSSDAEGEEIGQEVMEPIEHNYGAERDHDLDDNEEDDTIGDYMSDSSSSLSIPNESIDFDLVYSLTNFSATVEGQASVVKGDSLFLMDDSNSYWWLVRVLKTQEVGYIPAENIETPFERLARLNRHRNVDLASATQAEVDSTNPAASKSSRSRNRVQIDAPGGDASATNGSKRGVAFHRQSSIFRYPPAVWNEDEEEGEAEWSEDDVEIEDAPVKDVSTPTEEQNETNMIVDSESKAAEDIAATQRKQTDDVEMQMFDERGSVVPAALRAGPYAAGKIQQTDQQVEQQDQPQNQSQQQQLQQQGQQPQLRSQTSRERLIAQQGTDQQARPAQIRDPAEETETKRLVITPSIARDEPIRDESQQQQSQQQTGPGPLLPSAIIQKHQEQLEQERKRAREEIEAAEEAARKRTASAKGRGDIGLGPAPIQSQQRKEMQRSASEETRSTASPAPSGHAKLRKDRSDKDKDSEDSERDSTKEKKKKGSVFSGLFGRKKDKDKGSKASIENMAAMAAVDGRTRGSEESSATVSSSAHSHVQTPYTSVPPESGGRGVVSPAPAARQQLQQRVVTPIQQPQQIQPPPPQSQLPQQQQQQQPATIQVSQHASSLRERDQQQQALYSEYLKRSPSSPPEQPSYATQSASLVMPSPPSGSLSSSPSSSGLGLGLAPVNASFRTPSGRPGSLILSPASGVEGQNGMSVPELSVIRVFAGDNLQSDATFKTVLLNASTTATDLVRQSMQRFRLAAGEDASDYYLTVKQVEGGTTLKLTPDMKPLGVFEQLVEEAEQMPMRVKRSSMGSISSVASNLSSHPAIKKLPMNDFTDDSAVKFYLNRVGDEEKDDSNADNDSLSTVGKSGSEADSSLRGRTLSVSNSDLSNASPERFSSPSVRFAMQLVIYPEELPDNMVFDPHTEAIVFKETLRERSGSSSAVNPDIHQNLRKKYFNFPKNITVAEVIELGLERFGILEGVVDGGDEVEDKLTKRRSTSRVRYILTVQVDGQERELQPSSKVIDAFPRPPTYRRSSEIRRRSVDSAQLLLGSPEDIQSDDPVFILRRAVAYRPTSNRQHRLSAPLDELALSYLHRDTASSDRGSTSSETKTRQMSRQEIIAAQRAASRANQKAILSAQANSQRGIDVMLPDKAMLRSQRIDTDSKMRYSYVQPDGETYDVSDIVEEELKTSNSMQSIPASGSESSMNDLLSGAMKGGQPSALINRVLDKIKNGPVSQSTSTSTFRSTSPSMYSEDGQSEGSGSRTATPTALGLASHRSITPTANKDINASRSRSVTPTVASDTPSHHQYQPSIESVLSDVSSDYRTAASATPVANAPSRLAMSPSPIQGAKRPRIPKGEFGLTEMLAVIHSKAMLGKEPAPPSPDEVDKLFFGTPIDPETVHPQIRDVYAGTFKKMKEIDMELDTLLQKALKLF
ncbi:BUD14 [Sanghuangporus vaninii]